MYAILSMHFVLNEELNKSLYAEDNVMTRVRTISASGIGIEPILSISVSNQ